MINKDEFDRAFRESIASEFKEISLEEEDIDYVFSRHFENKMENILYCERKEKPNRSFAAFRKIAILVIVILSIFTTACSVDIIRIPVVQYIIEIYDGFKSYFFEGNTTKVITYEYKITELPEGFKEIKKIKDSGAIIITYANDVGDAIEFSQFTTENTGHIVMDDERITYEDVISDKKVEFRIQGDIVECYWIQEEYFMSIVYMGAGDVEIIKKIIQSIQ